MQSGILSLTQAPRLPAPQAPHSEQPHILSLSSFLSNPLSNSTNSACVPIDTLKGSQTTRCCLAVQDLQFPLRESYYVLRPPVSLFVCLPLTHPLQKPKNPGCVPAALSAALVFLGYSEDDKAFWRVSKIPLLLGTHNFYLLIEAGALGKLWVYMLKLHGPGLAGCQDFN